MFSPCPSLSPPSFKMTDCMSAVPGFESAEFDFLKDAEEAGLQLCNAADMFVKRTESTE